jgi:ribosomal protein L11 methyltransferase
MTRKQTIEVCLTIPGAMQEEASLFLADVSGRSVIIEDDEALHGTVRIRSLMESTALDAPRRKDLEDYLERLKGYGLHPLGMGLRDVFEEEWIEEWKARAATLRVGSMWLICPPGMEAPASSGEKIIVLGHGNAFGSGRHPSTILSLEALERAWHDSMLPAPESEWSALDVGTGTGILAIAAGHLGAKVLAIDIDDQAVAVAEENLGLNALRRGARVEAIPPGLVKGHFQLILSNITLPSQLELVSVIRGLTGPGGVVILSGFLEKDAEGLEARHRKEGLGCEARLRRGGWAAMILRSPPSPPSRALPGQPE